MFIIPCNPKWAELPASVWLEAFKKRSKEKLSSDVAGIVDELIQHFPQPGEMTHAPVPVILRKGRTIAVHRHPEHLIIYYPIGHPARLLTEFGNYILVKNTAVYLPPNAQHSVERVTSKLPRLSLALRWKTT